MLIYINHIKHEDLIMKKLLLLFLTVFALGAFGAEPSSWIGKVFPEELTKADGGKVSAEKALTGKIVAVYFSASWCPPCRAFTPKLVSFYRKAVRRHDLEIVLISSDQSVEKMMEYMKKYNMPWLALHRSDPQALALSKKMQIRGIPTLVVLDKNGKLITKNGRSDVTRLGVKAAKNWESPDKAKEERSSQKKSGKNRRTGKSTRVSQR